MKDILYVNGNIIFKSGNHLVKELVAPASEDWKRTADNIIEEDLVITENDILEPYTILCASDIIANEDFIRGMQRPDDVIKIYNEEIEHLQVLRKEKISSDLIPVLNRQIYIGIVGTMELFLCDFLFSMVLGSRKYYNKFCENSTRHFKLKEISTKHWKIQDAVMKAIVETNYHKVDEVKRVYNKILDMDFPPIEKLKKLILTRHALVHRNGFPSRNSEYIKVNDAMIDELIAEVKILVDHIIKTKEKEIDDWFPEPKKK